MLSACYKLDSLPLLTFELGPLLCWKLSPLCYVTCSHVECQQVSPSSLTSLATAECLTCLRCCRNADRPGDLRVQLCGDQEVAGLQEAWQPGGEGLFRGPGGLLQGLRRERLPRRHLRPPRPLQVRPQTPRHPMITVRISKSWFSHLWVWKGSLRASARTATPEAFSTPSASISEAPYSHCYHRLKHELVLESASDICASVNAPARLVTKAVFP